MNSKACRDEQFMQNRNPMTKHPSKPDVESIIADIQKNVTAAEASVSAEDRDTPPSLDVELATANRFAAAGTGSSGIKNRILRRLLNFLVDDINAFQAAAVRVLNILVTRVNDVSGEENSQLLETARRAEAKQVELEKRIHALEQSLKDNGPPS